MAIMIALPEHIQVYIESQVAEDRFETESAVIILRIVNPRRRR